MISNYLLGNGILYNKNDKKNSFLKQKTMATDNHLIEELKELIDKELMDCNHVLWPKVCEMQSTEKGKIKLQEMIIRYVAEEAMPIGSAIALIEQELSHTL